MKSIKPRMILNYNKNSFIIFISVIKSHHSHMTMKKNMSTHERIAVAFPNVVPLFEDAFADTSLETFESQSLALGYNMSALRHLTWRAAADFIFPNYRKSHNVFKAMMTLTSPDELKSMCDNVVCTVLPREQDVIDVKTVLGEEFTQFVRKDSCGRDKGTVAITRVF